MSELASIHAEARIGERVELGAYSVIHRGVRVGSDCRIGSHVVIHAGTIIGARVRIDDHAVLGKSPMRAAQSRTTEERPLAPLEVGDEVIIGTGAVLYAGSLIGRKVLVADLSSVREDVVIGELTILGRGVYIENRCSIGSRVKVESNAYLCAYSTVEDGCFIAPCVATSNDNYMGRDPERVKHYRGVTVRRGGRIGVHATILPGRVIDRDGQVAAGAVVTRDVDSRKLVQGVPARVVRDVVARQLLDNQ